MLLLRDDMHDCFQNHVKGECVWSGWRGVSAGNTTTRALDQHLADLNSFWSYNESDLSKYEDFDHSRFLGQYLNVFLLLEILNTKNY